MEISDMFRLEQGVVNVLKDFLSQTELKLETIRQYVQVNNILDVN